MSGRYKAYGEYKDSGVEWLGEIPKSWKAKRLAAFFEERREKVSDKDYSPLSVTMKGIVPQLENAAKTEAGDNRKLVLKNDFVINSRSDRKGSSGVSSLVGSVSLISIVMVPTRIYPYFAHHLLRSYSFQEEFYRYGKGIVADLWSTNSSEMKNILIPEVPMREQEAIAAFLDHETAKIDTLIDKQQQLIELLKEKRQAVISHAVTKGLDPDVPMKDSGVEWLGEVPEHWKVIYIKHLSEVKRGASPRPIDDQKYFDEEGEYAWTRIADVSLAGMYLKDTQQRLSSLGSSLSVKLERGELFLSIAGTVGKPCITTSKACIHDGFVYFPSLKINNKYLFYIFDAGQAYLGLGKMGTQLNLNTDTVGCIKVGLPPSLEIHEIVSYIVKQKEKYDLLISSAYEFIELIQERRTALISAAVTGKIDVRDWQVPATQTESDEVMA
ncbi:restriction endonuclease subunit S [Rahnella sp. PAMC25617]|uniref:restriction endonuclease subunit S n=1 Tax=Rahnella sp. PAMC25617 TaxID=3399684 RepID=UPI003D3673BA